MRYALRHAPGYGRYAGATGQPSHRVAIDLEGQKVICAVCSWPLAGSKVTLATARAHVHIATAKMVAKGTTLASG